MFNQFIEVFKTGTHTDGHGHKRRWTDADLQQFVDNHDAEHAAPIVLGHPKSHTDNYGQVDQLKLADGILSATFKNIDPTFEKIVASGEVANRSIRAKKTAAGWTLDHVGFLGKSQPAIANLAPMFSQPNYADTWHDYLFEFNLDEVEINPYRYRSGISSITGLFRRVREFIIDKHSLGVADSIIPDDELSRIADAGDAIKPKPYESSFSQPKGNPPMNEPQFTQAQVDALTVEAKQQAKAEAKAEVEAEFAEQLRDAQQAQKTTETKQQVKDFIATGKVTPAMAQGMAEFMSRLDEHTEYSFNKGDDTGDGTGKTNANAWFAAFVGRLNAGIHSGSDGSLGDDGQSDCTFSAHQIARYAKKHGVDPVTALDNLKSGDQ